MLLFGALFALFSRPLTTRSVFADGYFWHGLVFVSFFNIAVVYAALHFPAWMWMYFWPEAQHNTVELFYIFVFLYYLPYMLGFYLGRDLKRVSLGLTFAFLLLMLLTEGWLIHRLFERYSLIGSAQEFFAGKAVNLFGPKNPMRSIMNTSLILMGLYFVLVWVGYRRSLNRLKRL